MGTKRTVRSDSTKRGESQGLSIGAPIETSIPIADHDETIGRLGKMTPERLSVPLRGGKVDWDAIRPTTRDRLRVALEGSDLATATASRSVSADLSALVGPLYDMLGLVAVNLARAAGYDRESAGALTFSVEEQRALTDPTTRVLAKYAGDFAYADEIILATMLTTIVTAKWAMLRRPARVLAMADVKADADES